MSFPLKASHWTPVAELFLSLYIKKMLPLFSTVTTQCYHRSRGSGSCAPVAARCCCGIRPDFLGLFTKFKDVVVWRSRTALMIYEWISMTFMSVLYLSKSGLLFDGGHTGTVTTLRNSLTAAHSDVYNECCQCLGAPFQNWSEARPSGAHVFYAPTLMEHFDGVFLCLFTFTAANLNSKQVGVPASVFLCF